MTYAELVAYHEQTGLSRETARALAHAQSVSNEPLPMTAREEAKSRNQVNVKLYELGKHYHHVLPLSDIDCALLCAGFNVLEEAIYCGRDGHSHEQVGPRTWLSLSWHKMESGRFEVTAYVS